MTSLETHKVVRLGHQGDGITQSGLLVPRALPGETVSGQRVENRLDNPRIETPSSDRVSPPCRHAKSCGGCQLQHASDRFLICWKQSVVEQALAAHSLETRFRPIVVSPGATRRRAVFSARRTKKGALAGFHAKGSDQIVAIPDCRLLHPDVLAAVPFVETITGLGASRRAELNVNVTISEAGLDISVDGGETPGAQTAGDIAAASARSRVARLVWNGETIANRFEAYQTFGSARVVPPPGAFLQATGQGEAALVDAVYDIVGPARRVVDLFAGCGTFTLPLAQLSEVHAVEGSAAMTTALDKGWRHAEGLKQVTTEARDLFRRPLLPDELARFGACVIDPPRAGAEAQIAQIWRAKVPVIAYVSCNPVTFARDAKALTDNGYHLEWVQVVDQFRWSSHVELVGKFALNSV